MIIICLLIGITIFYNKKGVPWFLYHHIGEEEVPTEWFESHLKFINKLKMKTLTNRDLEVQLKENGKIEKNSIFLTFDDGYYDNYSIAHPLLKKYKIKATLYLNTAYIEENKREYKYLSWKEIEEMYMSGYWDIQLHSHKHAPIFINTHLERIVNNMDLNDRDLKLIYGKELKLGYPIFAKRGEYSAKGIKITKKIAKKFKNFYDSLEGMENKKIEKCQDYIDEILKNDIKLETNMEAKERIVKDLKKNILSIERYCGYKPTFFCWPWGHKGKISQELLIENGIKGFVTTKKGTNKLKIDLYNIKRIELRKFTPLKFKINLLITRNYILGKIYQIFS